MPDQPAPHTTESVPQNLSYVGWQNIQFFTFLYRYITVCWSVELISLIFELLPKKIVQFAGLLCPDAILLQLILAFQEFAFSCRTTIVRHKV